MGPFVKQTVPGVYTNKTKPPFILSVAQCGGLTLTQHGREHTPQYIKP